MAMVAAMAVTLVVTLRTDVAYFFSRPEVQSLGEAATLNPATLQPNTQVRVLGTPMASGQVHFGRVRVRVCPGHAGVDACFFVSLSRPATREFDDGENENTQ